MEVTNKHVDAVINDYIERYVRSNQAASIVRDALNATGIGLRPVVDHVSIRTLDVQERALEFEAMGFAFDDRLGVLERDSWWGKVYRKPGFPAVYIDQAFTDHRGKSSLIPAWVAKFTDGNLHHIAISVERIEFAVARLGSLGLRFVGEIMGAPDSEFRQIYTEPEVVDGEAFSVLELVERRWGYAGFLSPSPKGQMER
jgi:hypothetical protein